MQWDDGSVRYGRDFSKHICTTFQSRCQGDFPGRDDSTDHSHCMCDFTSPQRDALRHLFCLARPHCDGYNPLRLNQMSDPARYLGGNL